MRNIIDEIQVQYEGLSKSEKKIADYIILNKQETIQANIREFASQANVSIATITRFCKKINCQSFIEFKLLLQDSLQTIDHEENIIDSTEQLYKTIIHSSHALINYEDAKIAVDWMINAARIHIYGIGSSGLTGEELKLRLHRMKRQADTHLDSHTMLMNASIINNDDIVIAISNSGKTKEVLEAVSLAKNNKATVIALTNHEHTPLSELADLTLFTASYRTYKRNNFINSQLSIMFVIDVLSRLLLEEKALNEHYQQTLEALNQHKKI